jgi:uncharacterized protein (TIGR03118 family)
MKNQVSSVGQRALQLAALIFGLALSVAAVADGNYIVHNLVSDLAGVADHQDPNLKNRWGIVFGPTSPVWVSDNSTGVATVYDGNGNPFLAGSPPQPLVVTIPGGSPTGITFNPSGSDFPITCGTPSTSQAATFLWATENGIIAAWRKDCGLTAVTIPTTATPNGVYKGIAIAGNGATDFRLFAADLFNEKIQVFDSNFMPTTVPGGFVDPNLPPGFAPFNILNLQGNLYVAYAFHVAGDHDETAGPGLGIVDVFDANGFLIGRVATGGKLNAPWGMAIAPAKFGQFSGMLLVGNFGDGKINAFDTNDNEFAGQLQTANGQVLVIDGLWGIAFGNNFRSQPANTLFFAAGPNGENDGLYGTILPAPNQGEGDNNQGDNQGGNGQGNNGQGDNEGATSRVREDSNSVV